MANSYDIRNNEGDSRFETTVEGQTAFAEYYLEDDTIRFTHTEVPIELEGRGIASAIVKNALEHARREKLKVVPQCAYVRAYIDKHPEYKELVG